MGTDITWVRNADRKIFFQQLARAVKTQNLFGATTLERGELAGRIAGMANLALGLGLINSHQCNKIILTAFKRAYKFELAYGEKKSGLELGRLTNLIRSRTK